MDDRGLRVGQNEVLFREVNERLRELGEGFSLVAEESQFVCECGSSACTEQIRMTLAEYETVRSDSKHFFVRRGHELPVGDQHRPSDLLSAELDSYGRDAVYEEAVRTAGRL